MSKEMHWYAVHTYSGHEAKVQRYLESLIEDEGFEDSIERVVVPTEDSVEMKDGKKRITKRKFLPSYILVKMVLNNDTIHLVSSTPGVTSFVGPGRKPQALHSSEIDRILGQVEKSEGKAVPKITINIGDKVKVIDGPFNSFTGVIEEVNDEKKKLKVMVKIFGRKTPLELSFLQVEKDS